MRLLSIIALSAAIGACQPAGQTGTLPGSVADDRPYEGIAPGETVRILGTEPFWGGRVAGNLVTYETPENPGGERISVTRFAGRNGISWTGQSGGSRFALAVTPGECSDGMSDRTYPFVATLEVRGEQRNGCAWTERAPFSGPAQP